MLLVLISHLGMLFVDLYFSINLRVYQEENTHIFPLLDPRWDRMCYFKYDCHSKTTIGFVL